MPGYEALSDERLIELFQGGETAVLDYLMEKYKGMVLAKARPLFLTGGDTDDLIQEGMIGLFKAVRDYRAEKGASFLTFASLCIDRQMFHAISHSQTQKNIPLNSYVSLTQEDGPAVSPDRTLWDENPEAIVLSQEADSFLRQYLKKNLSRMENEVLARYLNGESYREIAEALGKEPKAIDNAIQRIRRKLETFKKERETGV